MLLNNNKSRENRAPRIRAILLLLLIFTSAITTLPILQSADAGAVTKYTDISSMTDQIKSLLYSNTIEDCMKNSSLNDSSGTGWTEISDTDAKSGQWFRAGNSLIKWGAQRLLQGNFDSSIGVYMKDTTGGAAGEDNDGLVECGNPSLILGALALWGLTGEELDVLCNSGFTRTNIANTQNVDQCVKGTGNLKRTDSNFNTSSADFTNYINAQVYDSAQQPELTPAQWYLFYRHSLNESCIPGIDTTAPQVGVTLSGSNSYNNVTWVDASNQPETGAYGGTGSGALKASTGVDIGLIMTSNDLKTTTTKLSCSNIVNLMSNAAKPYAVWTTQHPDEVAAINAAFVEDNNDKPKTCGDVVEGIGWIICPVMNFITKVNDASYRTISALLITPSLNMSTSSDNSLYQAWGAMRSLANVAFVIAFLIIIFSQLTSVGITNYGIKKMLPRLVIAAILVNLSYFVCAIAVDVSNVLGTSFIQFFNSIGGGLNQPKFTNGTGWTSLLLTVVGGGALLYADLSILLPALITALFAIITVFLTLTVRQALIIILVVISPLAFVAYLLPNTESLFKKWQNLLTTLLLLFPIVAIVFGASALASQVIINSATNTFVQIMGALVAVIPLFLVPSLMKAGGSVLGKVSGAISNNGLMKGASGGLNKVAEDYRKDRLNTRDMRALKGDNQFGRGRFVRWRNKTKSIRSGRESEMNRANTEYIAGQAEDNAEFRNALAGGTNGIKIGGKVLIRGAAAGEAADNRALASAKAQRKKIEEDEVTNAETLMRAQNDATVLPAEAQKIFENAVKSGNTVQARAAQRILLSSGAPVIKMLHESVEKIRGTDGSNGTVDNRGTINSLRNDINTAGIKGKDAVLSAWGYKNYDPSTETDPVKRAEVEEKKRQANADLGYDGVSIGTIGTDIGTFSGLNPVELAGQDIAVLREARGVSGNQARDVINNQNASQLLSDEKREHFKKIAAADPVPSTEAPPIIFGPI